MYEIAFLGTSASAPSISRGLSSALLLHRDHRFLLDCGEGTQRQLLRSGLGFRKLDKVLLTHGHLDHILGLGGLLSTFSRWESIDELTIYGGHWALRRVRDLLGVVLRGDEIDLNVRLTEIEPGVIWQDDDLIVRAFGVSHRGPDCYGYSFEEPTRRPFLAEEAERLGVPHGPERRRLVQGEAVQLADGRAIEPDDVLGTAVPGLKYVHVGDAGRTDNLVEICRGADALVIEATYLEEEADLARRFGHLTARQAAELAVEADVRQLFLVHISRRYAEREVRREARAVFPGVIVPRDLDVYRISRESIEKVPRER
ncbi:MAG: ribonuclease Z [Anaerolineae bacterium]|jgi:ribonuclease Z